MSDDLGIRKLGRRRKTTRRLTRRSVGVPGDEVTRQTDTADEHDEHDEHDDLFGDDSDSGPSAQSRDRQSADMIDADLEMDGDEPSSGVMHAPVNDSDTAPVATRPSHAAPPLMAATRASPSPLPVPAAVRASAPPPAGVSEPPPATIPPPAALPSDNPPAALAAPSSASASSPPVASVRHSDEHELDEATNPQIRLSELAPRHSSAPPVHRAVFDTEEATRPRIEVSRDLALVAAGVAGVDKPTAGEEVDIDTNPRIRLAAPKEAPGPLPPVVITRARVISDPPGAPAPSESVSMRAPRPSQQPKPAPEPEHDDIETLDIEVGEDSSAGKLEIPSELMQGAAAQVRNSDPARGSKAPPPPPPPPIDAAGKAALPKKPALPAQAAAGTTSTVIKPPAQALVVASSVGAKPPPPPPAAPKKTAPKPKRRYWWEDFFSDDYLHSIRRPTGAQVAKQVDFLEQSLGLSKGDAVLDVGCGLGLHALELARRGYLVVGMDLSLPMITRAAEEAQQEGLRINFMHADIREMTWNGMFDAVICIGTSFGFFDDETNRDLLSRMSQALKPGGRLLLDVVNRDYVVRSQPNLVWFEGDGCVVMEESDFNYFTSRLTVKRTMMRDDGRQSDAEYSIRLYSLHELGQMMQLAAVRVSEVSGQEATRGVFFGSHSTRMMLLGERRAPKGQSGHPGGNEGEPPTGEISKPPTA